MAINSTTLVDAKLGADAAAGARRRRLGWIRGLKSPKVVVGFAIVAFFGIIAIIGPAIAPYDPSQVSKGGIQPPSPEHWLGTTQIGQDLLSQMLYGAQISMFVGFGAAVIATAVSVLIGLTAGYLGGIADDLLSLLTNVFLVLPGLPLAIILVALVPQSGSVTVIFVIAVTGWAWGARVLRAQTLSLRRRDFVEAARATGEGPGNIIFRDILPNQVAVIAASFLGTVTAAILTQASLAFLGLTAVTEWSWGTILYWAQAASAYLIGAWWWFVPAGLAIAVLGTGLSLLNFGIDEFINPRLRLAGIGTKRAVGTRLKRTKARAGSRGRAERIVRMAGDPYTPNSTDVILEVKNLKVDYLGDGTTTPAVNDVSLTLRRGEVLGIAGESGSGKSTLAYAITRLHKPPALISDGEITYTKADGSKLDILGLSEKELREFRWEELSIVFQSAMNALNPILPIGKQIDDVLRAHRPSMRSAERVEKITELFAVVGIQKDRVNAYPHELSGGMRQRAMIAIGLALDPEIIVMDEPTTALDVVIQRQIVEKIMELKDRLGFSVIFITHDISLLIELSDTIAIMYAGRIVEVAAAEDFYRNPRHPYSRGLLESFPNLSGTKRELIGIPGAPPDLRKLPIGCAFAARCPAVSDACLTRVPPLFQLSESADEVQAKVACLLYGSDADNATVSAAQLADVHEERRS